VIFAVLDHEGIGVQDHFLKERGDIFKENIDEIGNL
jgi:hypothetical protein